MLGSQHYLRLFNFKNAVTEFVSPPPLNSSHISYSFQKNMKIPLVCEDILCNEVFVFYLE